MGIFEALHVQIFSVSNNSSVISMISASGKHRHSASETESCPLALVLGTSLPLHDSHHARFHVWNRVDVYLFNEDSGIFLEYLHVFSVINPNNMGPLASTIWEIGLMNKLSHWPLMTLTPNCLIVLPAYAFRVVLSWLYTAREFPDSSRGIHLLVVI